MNKIRNKWMISVKVSYLINKYNYYKLHNNLLITYYKFIYHCNLSKYLSNFVKFIQPKSVEQLVDYT